MYRFTPGLTVAGRLLIVTVATLVATVAQAQAPAWQWGLQCTNPTPSDSSVSSAGVVATDSAGRVYVAGGYGTDYRPFVPSTRYFDGAGTVGPGKGSFIAQATAAGQWSWVTDVAAIGTTLLGYSGAGATALVVTKGGELYVAGSVVGTGLRVGGITAPLPSTGVGTFVARLSSAGVCQWVRVLAGSAELPHLALDPSTGGVVLGLYYSDSLRVGTTMLPVSTSWQDRRWAVARLSAAGQWLSAVAPTGSAHLLNDLQLAVGPAGQVAVTGSQVAGACVFGSHTLTTDGPNAQSFVVAQLSPTNHWDWAVGGTQDSRSEAFGAGYTASGRLWVYGLASTGTAFGSQTITDSTADGGPVGRGFVGQLSSTGQWDMVYLRSLAYRMAVDAMGQAVLLSHIGPDSDSVSVQVGSQLLTAPPRQTLHYLARLDSTGQCQYVATLPPALSPNGLSPYGLAVHGTDEVYVVGQLNGSMAVGNTILAGTYVPIRMDFTYGEAALLKFGSTVAQPPRLVAQSPGLVAFPNPTHATTTLRLSAPTTESQLATLFDGIGRPVRTLAMPAHTTEATLDLTGLTPGLYLVRCGTATARLVVE